MAELDPLDVDLGRRLREMRNARHMSMQMLGEAIGVTCQQIQKYETGANRIAASTLYRIASVLGGWC